MGGVKVPGVAYQTDFGQPKVSELQQGTLSGTRQGATAPGTKLGTYLDVAVAAYEQVVRFQVPVDNSQRVDILQSADLQGPR